jgi:inhibitor of the pro-sigma K processing machinery
MNILTIAFIIVVAGIVLLFMRHSQWKPVRWIGWMIGQFVIGSIVLFVFNFAAQSFSFYIPINPVTSSITGFLGLPGLITLIIIKYFFLTG